MRVKNDPVDWEDPALARWMGSITRDSTKKTYRSGFRRYAQHTGLTATQMIDEALEDQRRDPREKTDIVKQRLIGFYKWLVTEAPKKKRVKGGGTEVMSKGLSSKIGHTYTNSVRSFYGTFDVYVKLKGRSRLPKARVTNKRMIVNNMDVKRLVDHASSPRDRAIILTLFQGGMDVSTLCDLKYRDVSDGLKKGEHPLKLEPYRLKTGTENYSFLGRDACEALNAYINDAKSKGLKFNYDTPLFLKGSVKALKGEGMTTNLVQAMMRKLAVKTGLVDEEEMKARSFNPLGPHALRESFGSIMIGKGVPDTVVDFWLGHEIGEMAEAYKRTDYEDLQKFYLDREVYISISAGGELKEDLLKTKESMDEQNNKIITLYEGMDVLRQRNEELKETHARTNEALEEKMKDMDRTLRNAEGDRNRLKDAVGVLTENVEDFRYILNQMIGKYRVLKDDYPEIWNEIEELTRPPKKATT